jgi:hypothetical protein
MAAMMKVCELFERNAAGENPYRYLAGWMNPEMRVVVMPNRDKRAASDADWVLYLAPVARAMPEGAPEAPPP